MATLTLGEQDARIVALGIAYHLGRPGSETDPDTLVHHGLGLGPLQAALVPQLGRAQAVIEVTQYQLHRLDESLLGLTNELKQYDLAQRRSAVPGLEAAIARLFPQLSAIPGGEDDEHGESALDLVTHVVLLRRRLDGAVAEAALALAAERASAAEAARAARRPWWRRWRPGRGPLPPR